MAHHQAGRTTKKIQGNYMLKVPQSFSLQKTIHVIEMGKVDFFLFCKKIFSIKKLKSYSGHSENTVSHSLLRQA